MVMLTDSLLIVTDLDGSLLDHHTYQWQPAAPWLARLRAASVPLVICSSKTASEIRPLQQQLGIAGSPFISENGARVYFASQADSTSLAAQNNSYLQLCHTLHQLRQHHHYRFTGFADVSAETVAQWTGLPLSQAVLAQQREGSESFIWQDSTAQWSKFSADLQRAGLHAIKGGRFWHVMPSGKNKAEALKQIRGHYPAKALTIGLGDGPNDIPMLESTDYAIVIHNPGSAPVRLQHPNTSGVYYTQHAGPEGWSEGLDYFIEL
ncbi:MAG: Mannosyl-3-phosphoglycerate phosphatase [Candidatus Erwinia impunctatus]|nr:Mannosyl-3-phosphoglycerate phosphatase [Culicoides impunctatus]